MVEHLRFPRRTIADFEDAQNKDLDVLLRELEKSLQKPYIQLHRTSNQVFPSVLNEVGVAIEWQAESQNQPRTHMPLPTLPADTIPLHRTGIWNAHGSAEMEEIGAGTGQRRLLLWLYRPSGFPVNNADAEAAFPGFGNLYNLLDAKYFHQGVATSENWVASVDRTFFARKDDEVWVGFEHSAGTDRSIVASPKTLLSITGLGVMP